MAAALKEGSKLGLLDDYGRLVAGEDHHEFEVIALEEVDDEGDVVIRVELKQLN